MIKEYLAEKGWQTVYEFESPEKKAQYFPFNGLGISEYSKRLLGDLGRGIYKHQADAIKNFLAGKNVCLSTSTASGKSIVFYVGAIEKIIRDSDSKMLAIYPLKALGNEQEERWKIASHKSGLNFCIGRIDGGVSLSKRKDIINTSQVLIMTPDVIHAWLLSNLSTKYVMRFMEKLNLIAIDEAHTYSGVFGSNSSFLFRRLNHIISKFDQTPQYITASATFKNPLTHLKNLTGHDFVVIGPDSESSPKMKSQIMLVDPPASSDMFSSLSDLLTFISTKTDQKFICFVDSRKQTEQLAAITAREKSREFGDDDESEKKIDFDFLDNLNVFPYRAGYEEEDRRRIQDKLSQGQLRGIISTSALEMGIDIPYLTMGILVGIPNSGTSYYQRIGRIGRKKEGLIFIINDGMVNTRAVFRNPKKLHRIPLGESALYLDNPRIQYIHALCLARQGGENDSTNSFLNLDESKFVSRAHFPKNFIDLCNAERIGEISPEFQNMKAQAGDDPNHIFPLRDIDIQYQVELKRGPEQRRLGSLSYGQVMREAYPGAVYYYQTQSFRVYKINNRKQSIEVRREKKYTTKPITLPTMIFPNLQQGNIYEAIKYGDLIFVECNLQIREAVAGYKERRGRNEIIINYPMDPLESVFFTQSRFTRNYFTSGVIINHPLLSKPNVKSSLISQIIFEAFLMTVPFERQDVSFGDDKHRVDRGELFQEGDRFISIFDQTYGSLRLTNKILNELILLKVFEAALEIAQNDDYFEANMDTIEALIRISKSIQNSREQIRDLEIREAITPEAKEKIILPGSKGLDIKRNNEEFYVQNVFYHPKQGVVYEGKHLSEQNPRFKDVKIIIPLVNLREIPGESKFGYYDYNTGKFE